MAHDFETQRRETFDTFKDLPKGEKLPDRAEIDFLFFPEDEDADYAPLERALKARGFRLGRDAELLVATKGPMPVTPEAIWAEERLATEIALQHDFYPDGWDLGLES
jgi:hypothetical protein